MPDDAFEGFSPETRAGWAQRALEAYRRAKREEDSDDCDVVDLIADLMLFCKQEDIEPERILEMARMHFENERAAGAEEYACGQG
jgi:hypothetical protein